MIIKDRDYPIRLRMLEALINRLYDHCSKLPLIKDDYKGWKAGYKGELNTDYRLSFLPEKDYWILRDLRLTDDSWNFQIDNLILTRRYFLLIETKNHSGTLLFEKNSEQMIQTKQDKEKAYDHPVIQVNKQKWHFNRWLQAYNFKVPPIVTHVVISNPSTIIKTDDPFLYKYVVKGDVLVDRIIKNDKHYFNEIFQEKELKKISKTLLKKHSPFHPDILKTYSLSQADIQLGVQCPSCSYFGMKRMKWIWVCPHCLLRSKTAHHSAVLDYFLLIKPTMTNQELRDFLLLPTSRSSGNLLSTLNLPSTGATKGRVYHMPEDIETFFHLKSPKKQ